MARRPRRTVEDQLAAQIVGQLLSTSRGRQFLVIVAIVAALGYGLFWLRQHYGIAHYQLATGPTVRLASWNLRQFSDTRKHVDLPRIASVITSNHFDLVAIQEVKKNGEEVDRLLDTLGSPWRAARYSDTSGNFERFAFIYNADHVQEIGTPHFIATTDAVIFDRTPYQDTFAAGQFRFTLIEVHLSYTNTQRRSEEARALARFARNLEDASSADHVIVCGDFNEEPPHENLHYFFDEGWQSLNHDPTNLSGTAVFDTFLIDPQRTAEWNGTAASVHFDEQLFGNDDKQAEEYVSDHRPAYADFVTTTMPSR
jgi:hypothetical protein